MRRNRTFSGLTLAAAGVALTAGCVVPQPRGEGLYRRVQEPTTKAWYHLYLPADYVQSSGVRNGSPSHRWPLVLTLHGMKPYDNARPQEREWEKEADIYGYIVCAPELKTSDSFMEYPLTREHDYVLQDRRNVIAIMDHIMATTRADSHAVLATSWSCGGYLAHYFVNRYPERFSCLATRLSNFSPELMDESKVREYRDMPVAIFIGDGDFPACKSESEKAVAWYKAHRFTHVHAKMIDDMGHKRIPQTAAAFFAKQLDIRPLRPAEAADSVAKVAMTDYEPPAKLIASFAPPVRVVGVPPPLPSRTPRGVARRGRSSSATSSTKRHPASFRVVDAGRNYPFAANPGSDARSSRRGSKSDNPAATPPASGAGSARIAGRRQPANWLGPTRDPSHSARTPRDSPRRDSTRARPDVRHSRRHPTDRSAVTAAPPGGRLRDRAGRAPGRTGDTPKRRGSLASRQTMGSSRRASHAKDLAHAKVPARPIASGPTRSPEKPVQILIPGAAMGPVPFYLEYAVDLPRSVTRDADILWMDNGVWIGDEPRGVKILDIPGLHRISVLVITRNNQTFRGRAVVQVTATRPSDEHAAKARTLSQRRRTAPTDAARSRRPTRGGVTR
ncbi:MAG: hypothetical protein ACE5F9_08620 [Phycisphaerae bacterium]